MNVVELRSHMTERKYFFLLCPTARIMHGSVNSREKHGEKVGSDTPRRGHEDVMLEGLGG